MWPIGGLRPTLRIFTSSQRMLKAISSGVTAPMEMPMGEKTLSSDSAGTPRCLSRSRRLAPAPDHADVPGIRLKDLLQDNLIVFVSARDDHNIRAPVDPDLVEHASKICDDEVVGLWKSFPAGVFTSVVADRHSKMRRFGVSGDVARQVPGAEEDNGRRLRDAFDERIRIAG